MKAIISTTYDSKYLYFLPLVTWCWNRLGVDVICFMPLGSLPWKDGRMNLIQTTLNDIDAKCTFNLFNAEDNKEATYAQCARLYAACLDLPEDEILVTSDVDMLLFKIPPYNGGFTIFGSDLVPRNQYPMCYISAKVKDWRKAFDLEGKTYQEKLDELVGVIECEHFRGNQWSLDQGEAFRKICSDQEVNYELRARPGTQFATHRVDRDDAYWRDRVSSELVDAHLWRPGYEPNNLSNIMELMQMMYPYEDFKWLFDYTEQYRKLL